MITRTIASKISRRHRSICVGCHVAGTATTLLCVGWYFNSGKAVDFGALWIFEQLAGGAKIALTGPDD